MAKSFIICNECRGNGFIRGTLGNTGTCIHCHGEGHNNHGPRLTKENYLELFRLTEEFINGRIKGEDN